jgi:hypothetical protein
MPLPKRKRTRIRVVVEFDLPPGATDGDTLAYVETAVRVHCGGMDPADPMFHLRKNSVKVIDSLCQILEP